MLSLAITKLQIMMIDCDAVLKMIISDAPDIDLAGYPAQHTDL
jgi:hypothetical protein